MTAFRLNATYAPTAPAAEDALERLVEWWARRSPTADATGVRNPEGMLEVRLQVDALNPPEAGLRRSLGLAIPHRQLRLIAIRVTEAGRETGAHAFSGGGRAAGEPTMSERLAAHRSATGTLPGPARAHQRQQLA